MSKSLSLRTKVLATITAALLVLFTIQYFITRVVLFDSFAHLETERANLNLHLIRSVIEQNLAQLEGAVQDYAYWDETIAHLKGEAPQFFEENLTLQGFNNLKINAAILTDAKGKVVFSRSARWDSKTLIPTSQELLRLSSGGGPLWKHPNTKSKFSGLLMLPEGPALVASLPVLDSNAEGDIQGAFIWARYLDEPIIKLINDTTRLDLTLKVLDENSSPEALKLYAQLKDNPTYIEELSTSMMRANSLLSDIFGKPALIYSTNIQRDIYAQVVSTTGYLFWSSFAAFAILALISLLFDRLVVQRIVKLTRQVSEVGNASSISFNRIPESGSSDELAHLTGSVNNMLTRIEQGIAERKRAEDRIYLMAHYDQLTRLPNRVLLNNYIGKAIHEANKTQSQFAILFMDLDRFKNVNDSIGHQAGDELLTTVADRLRSFISGRAFISRLGGDEFVVLLPDLFNTEQAEEFAARLVDVLNRVCVIKGQEVNVSTSIGISVYPTDGEDIDTLIRNADTAMYRAKEKGRNNYVLYCKHMNADAVQRLQIESSLRHAIERNELAVHYQPVADLMSNQIISAEALLRWQHADLGYVSPGKFIPIAEETGQIYAIGDWVLRAVCKQLRTWLDHNVAVVPVAVNISPKQLQNRHFYQESLNILREYGIPTALIVFELTESTVMSEDEETALVLPKLQSAGIRIAIDDFGTGFSSFSRLHTSPVDILKIDQSFIRRINESADSEADNSSNVIKAMISMARALNIRVVAEGVETEAQSNFLRKNQCDAIQGYYISKALSAIEFGGQLRNQVQNGHIKTTPKPRSQPVSMLHITKPDDVPSVTKMRQANETQREAIDGEAAHPTSPSPHSGNGNGNGYTNGNGNGNGYTNGNGNGYTNGNGNGNGNGHHGNGTNAFTDLLTVLMPTKPINPAAKN
ncbi:MAG: EAL domain-containing protein [Anaerolineae bacterium]|nr:EAL domain-containing protein [Anaerolineae bacterium]